MAQVYHILNTRIYPHFVPDKGMVNYVVGYITEKNENGDVI